MIEIWIFLNSKGVKIPQTFKVEPLRCPMPRLRQPISGMSEEELQKAKDQMVRP